MIYPNNDHKEEEKDDASFDVSFVFNDLKPESNDLPLSYESINRYITENTYVDDAGNRNWRR